MRGRGWLIAGAILGVLIAIGRVPFLAGAGRGLADTTQHLTASGASHLIDDMARRGAPRRVVLGLQGLVSAVLPGTAAVLLVVAAKSSLRIRSVIAFLMVALGASSFIYQPHGKAAGELLLALAVGGLAVSLTGPLVAAPLVAVAALIGAEYLPGLLTAHRRVVQASVETMHLALFAKPGDPAYLQIVMLVVAIVPFALAGRAVLRS